MKLVNYPLENGGICETIHEILRKNYIMSSVKDISSGFINKSSFEEKGKVSISSDIQIYPSNSRKIKGSYVLFTQDKKGKLTKLGEKILSSVGKNSLEKNVNPYFTLSENLFEEIANSGPERGVHFIENKNLMTTLHYSSMWDKFYNQELFQILFRSSSKVDSRFSNGSFDQLNKFERGFDFIDVMYYNISIGSTGDGNLFTFWSIDNPHTSSLPILSATFPGNISSENYNFVLQDKS